MIEIKLHPKININDKYVYLLLINVLAFKGTTTAINLNRVVVVTIQLELKEN